MSAFGTKHSKMVHAALLLLMLGARTTVTPFHHQPEAQHLKSSAIHNNAGRLPHLCARSRHWAVQQFTSSFDYVVGTSEQRRRNVNAEHLRSIEIDHQLDLGRLLDRQVRNFGALQNLPNIEAPRSRAPHLC